MHFAYPLPWWLAVILAAAVGAAAFAEYRRPLAPLTPGQRGVLAALRLAVLAALVLFLFRPIVMLPPAGPAYDTIVPVLVDVSRSMRLGDADGQTRVARANALLKTLLPALKSHASPELFAVGDGIRPASIDGLAADARRSDLGGALSAVRERYRGQRLAGVVLISDGGDTGAGGSGGSGDAPVEVGQVDAYSWVRRRCLRLASGRPTVRRIARCAASRPAIRGSISRPSISTSPPSAMAPDLAARRSCFVSLPTAARSSLGV